MCVIYNNNYNFTIGTSNDAPEPWGLFFQDNATPQIEGLEELHNNIMYYLAIILFAVTWIMISTIINFKYSKNVSFIKATNHTSINIPFIFFILTSEILIGLLNVDQLNDTTRIPIYTNSDFLTTTLPDYDYVAICNNTSFSHYTSCIDLLNNLNAFITNMIRSLEDVTIANIPPSELTSALTLMNDIRINLEIVDRGILDWIEDLGIHYDEVQQCELQYIADLFNAYNNYMQLAERLSAIVQARHAAIMDIAPNIDPEQIVASNATIGNAGYEFNSAYIVVASRILLYVLVAVYYNTDLTDSPMSI